MPYVLDGKKEYYDEIEKYMGIAYEDADNALLKIMCRIQADFDNGTMGKDISYYAGLYGY